MVNNNGWGKNYPLASYPVREKGVVQTFNIKQFVDKKNIPTEDTVKEVLGIKDEEEAGSEDETLEEETSEDETLEDETLEDEEISEEGEEDSEEESETEENADDTQN